jgi:putative ABC transport system substrate-binding protein
MRRRDFITLLGGAAAWPLAARAQQSAVPVIGCLTDGTETDTERFGAAFHRGLGEQGYVEGRNIEILYRYAEARYDRLPDLAGELVRRRVAVIAAFGTDAPARAAKNATATIPIVFQTGADPVRVGLVASLNRPGGNVTGVSTLIGELVEKRFELLHELVPAATSIGYLNNPTFLPGAENVIRRHESVARTLGVRLVIANASTPSEIEPAFAMLVREGIGAFLSVPDLLFLTERKQLAVLAARYKVPAIYFVREQAEAGGLMSYGANPSDARRLAGTYVGRILNGEKPADLPIQQSTTVELIINMKAAKVLGLTVPLALLTRADEVIE